VALLRKRTSHSAAMGSQQGGSGKKMSAPPPFAA